MVGSPRALWLFFFFFFLTFFFLGWGAGSPMDTRKKLKYKPVCFQARWTHGCFILASLQVCQWRWDLRGCSFHGATGKDTRWFVLCNPDRLDLSCFRSMPWDWQGTERNPTAWQFIIGVPSAASFWVVDWGFSICCPKKNRPSSSETFACIAWFEWVFVSMYVRTRLILEPEASGASKMVTEASRQWRCETGPDLSQQAPCESDPVGFHFV